jgi:signal peptidase I
VNRRAIGCLLEAAETLVLTLVIFLIIQTFVAQPYKVEQQSMENTLEPQQYVLVDKLTPHFDSYKRGDIVVFMPPDARQGDIPFIKRVIGLGGDVVDIREGHVFINDQELSEPYVYPGQTTEATTGQAHWVIAAGTYFVLGDHRQNSSDSRVFGPIPGSSIIGRAWLRYWPIDTLSVLPTPTYPDLSPLQLPTSSPGSTGSASRPIAAMRAAERVRPD